MTVLSKSVRRDYSKILPGEKNPYHLTLESRYGGIFGKFRCDCGRGMDEQISKVFGSTPLTQRRSCGDPGCMFSSRRAANDPLYGIDVKVGDKKGNLTLKGTDLVVGPGEQLLAIGMFRCDCGVTRPFPLWSFYTAEGVSSRVINCQTDTCYYYALEMKNPVVVGKDNAGAHVSARIEPPVQPELPLPTTGIDEEEDEEDDPTPEPGTITVQIKNFLPHTPAPIEQRIASLKQSVAASITVRDEKLRTVLTSLPHESPELPPSHTWTKGKWPFKVSQTVHDLAKPLTYSPFKDLLAQAETTHVQIQPKPQEARPLTQAEVDEAKANAVRRMVDDIQSRLPLPADIVASPVLTENAPRMIVDTSPPSPEPVLSPQEAIKARFHQIFGEKGISALSANLARTHAPAPIPEPAPSFAAFAPPEAVPMPVTAPPVLSVPTKPIRTSLFPGMTLESSHPIEVYREGDTIIIGHQSLRLVFRPQDK